MLSSYQKSLLPEGVQRALDLGFMTEEQARQQFADVLSERDIVGAMSPAMSPTEQQEFQSFQGAGGADATTGEAMAASAWGEGIATPLRYVGQAAAENGLVQEGALAQFFKTGKIPSTGLEVLTEALSSAGSPYGFIADAIGTTSVANDATKYVINQLAPDLTDPEQQELAAARDYGRRLATSGASERGNTAESFAIDNAGFATQVGTSIASLMATKNPRLAAAIMAGSLGSVGVQSYGHAYGEARQAGYSPAESATRARAAVARELATESINFGGGSVSLAKNLLFAAGTGAVQETASSIAGIGIDTLFYDKLAPKDVTEAAQQVGEATATGAILTGALTLPAARSNAKYVENIRALQEELYSRQLYGDPAAADGARAGAEIQAKVEATNKRIPPPEQPDIPGLEARREDYILGQQDAKRKLVDVPAQTGTPSTIPPITDKPAAKQRAEILSGLAKDKEAEASALRDGLLLKQAEEEAGGTPTTQFDRDQIARAENEAGRLRRAGGAIESELVQQGELFPTAPDQVNPVTQRIEEAKKVAAAAEAKKVAEQKSKDDAAAKELAAKQAATRKQAEQEILAEFPNATPEQFDTLANRRARRLMEAAGKAATTKAPRKGKKGKKTQEVLTDVSPEPTASKADMDAKLAEMERTGDFSVTKGSGLSREAFRRKFIYDESAEGNRFRNAITSGKIKLVSGSKQVPELAEETVTDTWGGVHISKNGNIYINVKNINEDKLMPVIQHEVKHHMDRKYGDSGPGSLRYVVGAKANERHIAEIEKAAAGGDKYAKEAMESYNYAKKVNPGIAGRDEIVTYYLQKVAEGNKKGSTIGRIARDIVSSARTNFKEVTGLSARINLKDLEYLSRKMVDDLGKGTYKDQYDGKAINGIEAVKASAAAKSPDGKKPNADFSLIGPNAANWDEVKSTEFKGIKDGLPRKELDSSKATIKTDALGQFVTGKSMTVKDLMDFPDLFKAYPKIADLKVTYNRNSTDSSFTPEQESRGIVLGSLTSNPMQAKRKLLHEAQHYIQAKEGFSYGATPGSFLSQAQQDKADTADSAAEFAVKSMNDATVAKLAAAAGIPQAANKDMTVMRLYNEFDSYSKSVQTELLSSPAFSRYKKHKDISKSILGPALDSYNKVAGEAEARTVEARAEMSGDARKSTKFYDTLNTNPYAGNRGKANTNNLIDSPLSYDNPSSLSIVEEADLTHPRGRGFGETRDTRPLLLPMPTKEGYVKVSRDSIMGRTTDWINKRLSGGRVPTDVREILERMSGEQNLAALDAMTSLNQINTALNGTSNPAEVISLIRKAEDAATREKRLALMEPLKRDYPAVYAAYMDARRKIVLMSRDIYEEMTKVGYNPTKKERAIIDSIANNMGNYLTTTYKLFSPKKVRVAHLKWINLTKEGQEVKQAAIDWAENNLFTFNGLEKKSQEWLEAMYDAYVSDHNNKASVTMGRKELIAALEKVRNSVTPAQITKASTQFVDDLLRVNRGLDMIGRAARIYRGTNQDLTIITPKTNVPQPIRDLWGEQNNPVMNVFATLVRQGEFLAKIRSQYRLAEELDGTYLFKNSTEVPDGAQVVKLTGDAFGPLSGRFTTKEVAEALMQRTEIEKSMGELWESMERGNLGDTAGMMVGKGLRLAGKLGGKYKKLSVVWNPMNWVLNYGGSYMQLISNGNVGKYAAKGHKIAMRDAPGAAFKNYTTEEVRELLRNGVFDNSLAGEIQDAERRSIIEGLLQSTKTVGKVGAFTKFTSTVTDRYSAADVWAKAANYYYEKDFLEGFYKALGKPLSPEKLERMAAERVRMTNFTYNRAFSPAKLLESSGITNFLTYTTETFRTLTNNFVLGAQDVAMARRLEKTNPEAANQLRAHGTRRLIGASLATAGHSVIFSSIGSLIAMAIGAPEETPEEEQIKKGLPEWHDNRLLTLIGVRGLVREYFDAGRLDPFGPANDLLRGVATSVVEADVAPALAAAKALPIWNRVITEIIELSSSGRSPSPSLKAAAEDVYKYTKEAMVSELGMEASAADAAMRFFELGTPRVLQTVAAQLFTSNPEDESIPRRFFEAMGGRVIKYDPAKDLPNAAKYDFSSVLSDSRNKWSAWAEAQDTISDESADKRMTGIITDEFAAWDTMMQKVEAAELAGVNRRQMQNLLKDGGLNTEQINSLTRGRFYSTTISDSKLTGDMNNEIKKAANDLGERTPEYREAVRKIKQKYRGMSNVVRQQVRKTAGMENM